MLVNIALDVSVRELIGRNEEGTVRTGCHTSEFSSPRALLHERAHPAQFPVMVNAEYVLLVNRPAFPVETPRPDIHDADIVGPLVGESKSSPRRVPNAEQWGEFEKSCGCAHRLPHSRMRFWRGSRNSMGYGAV